MSSLERDEPTNDGDGVVGGCDATGRTTSEKEVASDKRARTGASDALAPSTSSTNKPGRLTSDTEETTDFFKFSPSSSFSSFIFTSLVALAASVSTDCKLSLPSPSWSSVFRSTCTLTALSLPSPFMSSIGTSWVTDLGKSSSSIFTSLVALAASVSTDGNLSLSWPPSSSIVISWVIVLDKREAWIAASGDRVFANAGPGSGCDPKVSGVRAKSTVVGGVVVTIAGDKGGRSASGEVAGRDATVDSGVGILTGREGRDLAALINTSVSLYSLELTLKKERWDRPWP